jgi:polyferredoxin
VCPTGVDIRDGAQLGCIQCGLCIDACDSVMAKINRPTGLIAYDTDQAIKARACGTIPPPRRLVRARTILYAAVIALVGGLMLYGLATRSMLDLGVIHERTPLFTQLRDGAIRNNFTLRIANKRPESRLVAVSVGGIAGATIEIIGTNPIAGSPNVVEVGPDQTLEFKLLVTVPRASLDGPKALIQIKAVDTLIGEVRAIEENFFGP